MVNMLMLDGWSEDGRELDIIKKDSNLKYLEEFASELHTSVENINKILSVSKYVIDTLIYGKEDDYKLDIKVQYYGSKSENEHKKNSHRQEIDI